MGNETMTIDFITVAVSVFLGVIASVPGILSALYAYKLSKEKLPADKLVASGSYANNLADGYNKFTKDLRDELETYRKENKELREELEKVHEEIMKLNGVIEALREELKECLSSKSNISSEHLVIKSEENTSQGE